MSNEEMVALIQGGETERMGELWEQVERFVFQQAGRLSRALGPSAAVTREDLYQSGYLALVAAAESYDPDRGMRFTSYLALRLKTAFAEAGGWRSKKQDPLDRAASLDAPLGESEDAGTLKDITADPEGLAALEEAEDGIWREQVHAALETALGGLPEAQEGAIRRRYYHGMTLEAAGADMGVSTADARKLEAQALRALRHPRVSKGLRAYLEERTDYYLHVGAGRFNTTGTSAVEELAMRREGLVVGSGIKLEKTSVEHDKTLHLRN